VFSALMKWTIQVERQDPSSRGDLSRAGVAESNISTQLLRSKSKADSCCVVEACKGAHLSGTQRADWAKETA
jgi:hypothetical protein